MPGLPKRSGSMKARSSLPGRTGGDEAAEESTVPLKASHHGDGGKEQPAVAQGSKSSDVKQQLEKAWATVGRAWDRIKLALGRNAWRMVDRRALAFRVSW
jgi:hypothetical protein